MGRPKNNRIVNEPPIFGEFRPSGMPRSSLSEIELSLDEFEAIRLANYLGMSHEEASLEMNVSRSTFSRLLEKSNKKLSEFIIKGRVLNINGGKVHFKKNIIKCGNCEYMFKININDEVLECPSCGSDKLINLAGGYGHGRCCHENR